MNVFKNFSILLMLAFLVTDAFAGKGGGKSRFDRYEIGLIERAQKMGESVLEMLLSGEQRDNEVLLEWASANESLLDQGLTPSKYDYIAVTNPYFATQSGLHEEAPYMDVAHVFSLRNIDQPKPDSKEAVFIYPHIFVGLGNDFMSGDFFIQRSYCFYSESQFVDTCHYVLLKLKFEWNNEKFEKERKLEVLYTPVEVTTWKTEDSRLEGARSSGGGSK